MASSGFFFSTVAQPKNHKPKPKVDAAGHEVQLRRGCAEVQLVWLEVQLRCCFQEIPKIEVPTLR